MLEMAKLCGGVARHNFFKKYNTSVFNPAALIKIALVIVMGCAPNEIVFERLRLVGYIASS